MPKKSDKEKKPKKEPVKIEKISQEEYEKKVVALAQEGLTSEKIGENLRRQKIHPKDYDKKISQILIENKLYSNPDEKNIRIKLEKIQSHYEKNKQDKKAMREKDRVFSQLRSIQGYLAK